MAGVGVGGSAAVGGDERAVEHDVAPAGGRALLEHGVQVGGSGGQHIDALRQVAVAGGRRDSGVAGPGWACRCPPETSAAPGSPGCGRWRRGRRYRRIERATVKSL
jgi:hypothetical protein